MTAGRVFHSDNRNVFTPFRHIQSSSLWSISNREPILGPTHIQLNVNEARSPTADSDRGYACWPGCDFLSVSWRDLSWILLCSVLDQLVIPLLHHWSHSWLFISLCELKRSLGKCKHPHTATHKHMKYGDVLFYSKVPETTVPWMDWLHRLPC